MGGVSGSAGKGWRAIVRRGRWMERSNPFEYIAPLLTPLPVLSPGCRGRCHHPAARVPRFRGHHQARRRQRRARLLREQPLLPPSTQSTNRSSVSQRITREPSLSPLETAIHSPTGFLSGSGHSGTLDDTRKESSPGHRLPRCGLAELRQSGVASHWRPPATSCILYTRPTNLHVGSMLTRLFPLHLLSGSPTRSPSARARWWSS